jgi:hypothetical protein
LNPTCDQDSEMFEFTHAGEIAALRVMPLGRP